MSRITFYKLKSLGTAGLLALMALFVASCGTIAEMTRTITPNAYSNSVGPEQTKADEDECFQFGMADSNRLLDELKAGDPSVEGNQLRESRAEDIATEVDGVVAGAVAGFLFSYWDETTYDESNLAKYLGIEGGLGAGFTATKRLQYTCLRAKGYEVEDHEEDGSGTAHLMWAEPPEITRVILREEDGAERVFYEYVP